MQCEQKYNIPLLVSKTAKHSDRVEPGVSLSR